MGTLTGMFRASKQSSSTFVSVLYFGLGAVTSAVRLERWTLVLAHAYGGFDLRERFKVGVDVADCSVTRSQEQIQLRSDSCHGANPVDSISKSLFRLQQRLHASTFESARLLQMKLGRGFQVAGIFSGAGMIVE
ncbi:hypothetical protein KC19_7G115600 [Ceratodon purpureus]|uniref:Uncharacterized protein n=1 Tax=Ceratodon purpureus TaxID=3225 RepID=A0A8T0H9W9_CERPU|nr:hypothetical protein KC19_7G115600 [Ceratodon purpureus]